MKNYYYILLIIAFTYIFTGLWVNIMFRIMYGN